MSGEEVARAMTTYGERYLKRIYTDEERSHARDRPLALAARFAAKEATLKALRRGDEPVDWRSIAVSHDAAGRPSLRLSRAAGDLARRCGVRRLELSFGYQRRLAVAIVLAELEP